MILWLLCVGAIVATSKEKAFILVSFVKSLDCYTTTLLHNLLFSISERNCERLWSSLLFPFITCCMTWQLPMRHHLLLLLLLEKETISFRTELHCWADFFCFPPSSYQHQINNLTVERNGMARTLQIHNAVAMRSQCDCSSRTTGVVGLGPSLFLRIHTFLWLKWNSGFIIFTLFLERLFYNSNSMTLFRWFILSLLVVKYWWNSNLRLSVEQARIHSRLGSRH